MKQFYYAMALISVLCISGDCENFMAWIIWEAVWIAVALLCLRQIDRLEEK